jgi:hypothetical protein
MRIPIYSRFIAGNSLKHAIQIQKNLQKNNVGTIFDFAVESPKKINRNINQIFSQINQCNHSFIALKLSSLDIQNPSQCTKIIDQFQQENLKKKYPNKFLIDAENDEIQKSIYEISNYALDSYNTPNNKYFYKTIQMYRKDAIKTLNQDIEHFFHKQKYAIKLVRGAYIKKDKNIICSSKEHTDYQYNHAIDELFYNLYYSPANEIMFATHNKDSYYRALSHLNKNLTLINNISFATLLGMGNNICFDNCQIIKKYKYVPYGPFWETNPYLFRRLIENIDIIKHI